MPDIDIIVTQPLTEVAVDINQPTTQVLVDASAAIDSPYMVKGVNLFEGQIKKLIAISQADYDGLTTEQKQEPGTIYFIKQI